MADIESTYNLDVKGVLDGLDQIISGFDKVEKKIVKISKSDPFREATKGSENFEKKILNNLDGVVRSEAVFKALKEEVKLLNVEQAKLTDGQKKFLDSVKYQKLKSELSQVKQELNAVGKELSDTTKKGQEASGMFGKLGGIAGKLNIAFQAFIGLKAVQYIYDIGKSVFDTSAKFEKYGKVLETALGSQDLSKQAMEALKKIAAETAFSMDELTNGYVKMVNRGLRPSTQEIIKLTDLAASQGKSFDQLVEAVLDAQTGEFERLKEFGIRAKKTGDDVTLAFKGQTASVKNNEKAIYDAIIAMGAFNGVAGQNAELMGTLDGKVSNLGDSVDSLSVKFGTVLKPVFDGILSGLSTGVSFLGSIVTGFTEWVGITSKTESSLSALNDQQKITFDSERKLQPLIARYEELKGKTVLNKTEQEELRKVITEIQKIVPMAATAFDAYGKALDINKDKVQDFISRNKTLTKEMKQLATENISKELEELAGKQLVLNRELNQGYQEIYEHGVRSEQKLTNEQIVKRQVALSDLKAQTIKLRRELRGLDGPGISVGELPTSGASTVNTPDIVDEKTLNARKKALEDAEKDLSNSLLKLEEQYGKDQLEALKDNELERIRLKKEQDLKAIKAEEEFFLKIRQIEAGAKKGQFDKDNKVIPDKSVNLSSSESAKYDFRRGLVDERATDETDAYYKKQAETISDGERNITELLSNEYQLQLQSIERKYEKALKLSENDGRKRLKLEKEKEQEIQKATLDKDLGDIDKEKNNAIQAAELSVIQAQIDGRYDLELAARNQLLQLEKEFNEKKIKVIEASGVKEKNALILPLQKANKEIEQSQGEITKSVKKIQDVFSKDYWLKQLGIQTEEGKEILMEAVGHISDSVKELYNTLNQLSQQRISRLDEEISKKQEQVDTEKELNEKGAANNLALREKELSDLKDARARAIKDQERIQKAQLIADTAMQVSSLITATAKLFSAHAGIPFVGTGIAIAATALMWGAFAASKLKAFQLAKSTSSDKYEFGGRIRGNSHTNGGVDVTTEVEGGEWVINKRSSAKHDKLLEAINDSKGGAILDYLVRDMLANTGISNSEPERKETMRFLQEYNSAKTGQEDENLKALKRVEEELREIKSGTNRIPESQITGLGENRYLEKTKNGFAIRDLPKVK